MSVSPVDRSEHRSAPLLDHLARRMRSRAETVLAPLGLRPRHMVALTLLRAQGGSSQQALAGTLSMDGTNIVGLLNELEAKRLVERRRSPEDRRRHVVELTEAGARQLREAECALAAAENEVLGALDAQQREALYELLQQAATGATGPCGEAVTDDPVEPAANTALGC
ncbi:MarR family winged helix-turn-helix transcriptional regulator [Micromonospora sp. NBC_00898]|uniref:MarR family winged helix-turn-helix transcriptional regulator n=1 Tax=Micromonospora sp. NBC_00898 TaxID=2975981 RepID=UPI003869A4B6|nr:MarR family winged helix-turn-helix transcriptional regulator [Micromonospora sp. NBC_00898]